MGNPNVRPHPDVTPAEIEAARAGILKRVIVSETGCWEWQGAVSRGYGSFYFLRTTWRAHRIAYLVWRGSFDYKLDLDHLCRNRTCVNPNHLEPVTPKVNVLRGVNHVVDQKKRTHCPKGHPYSGDNLIIRPSGRRGCRACIRIWKDESEARRQAEGRKHVPQLTHCKRGHSYEEHGYTNPTSGARICRACIRVRRAERKPDAA